MPARRTDRKPRLSTEAIVDVAMSQLRERGYDAVTMRSIATELGTGQASLYAHVANRNELDALVMTRISSMLVVPPADPERWDEQLAAMARDMLQLYFDHPGTARCTMGNVPASTEALKPVEAMFAIMRAGKVSDRDAALFGDQMALYIAAFAMELDIWKARARAVSLREDQAWDHIPEAFRALSPEEFPVITSIGDVMMEPDIDERFAFGIELLIQGLKARRG